MTITFICTVGMCYLYNVIAGCDACSISTLDVRDISTAGEIQVCDKTRLICVGMFRLFGQYNNLSFWCNIICYPLMHALI